MTGSAKRSNRPRIPVSVRIAHETEIANRQLGITQINPEMATTPEDRHGSIPCPFAYSDGRKCSGHIIGIEAYKADLSWRLGENGVWEHSHGEPRSHYHLICSEKGNHAGHGKPDSEQMKLYGNQLSDELKSIVSGRSRNGR